MNDLTASTIDYKFTTENRFAFSLAYQYNEYIYIEHLKVTLDEFRERWASIIRSERRILRSSVTLCDKSCCFDSLSDMVNCIEEYTYTLIPKDRLAS